MVDVVNVGGEPKDDAAEKQAAHDAAMAAKADSGVTSISSVNNQTGESINLAVVNDETGKPIRPEGVPEKFWDAEKGEVNVAALLKAQQDAEAALRQSQQPKKEGDPQPTETPKAPEAGQQNAVNAAADEWAEKGELSEETFKSLEAVGLTRDMVETHIAGQRAIVTTLQNAAFGEFDGTQESYQKATQWAADNLSDDEIKALDVQLTSTNPAIVAQGAKALAAKYAADADITPARTVTTNGDNNTVSGSYFKSSHEMKSAMADPRYKKDEAYRKEVAQKISRAGKAGVNLFS